MIKNLLLCFLVTPIAFGASVVQEDVQYTTSVSHAYGARSLFTNPAALAYEDVLNDPGFSTSYSTGIHINRKNEHVLGLSYGPLAMGAEWLATPSDRFNRYSFALGLPVFHNFYWGIRYQFTKAKQPSLLNYKSLDLGAQLRPSPYFSVGLLAQSLNTPRVNGTEIPVNLVGGVTLRPLRFLELSVDVDSSGVPLFESFGYEANARVEVLRGLRLAVGYHKVQKFQVGLQFNLFRSAFYSAASFNSGAERIMVGSQTSFLPRRSSVSIQDTLEVTLDSELREEPVRGSLFTKSYPSLFQILKKLRTAARDPEISTVVVRLEHFPLGLASAEEIFESLWAIREQGKTVTVYLESAGLREYFIASAANRIVMEPSAELRLLGFGYSRYYLKGTLDKLGIRAELLAKGKYKSMPEMFTRKGPSELSRKESLRQLREIEKNFLNAVSKSGRVTAEKWKEALKLGVFGPRRAKALGLIDSISSYEMENDDFSLRTTKTTRRYREDLALPPRIAVIPASGDIVARKSSLLSFGGSRQVYPKKMEEYFKTALRDPLTKVILLRVSSPGGEVLASQQIATLVEKANRSKPVIVSMGDVAASGGYMISAPGRKIFASPNTLTGSIGVFLGKASLQGLYKKIGLNKEILGLSPHVGLYSEHRNLSASDRAILVRRLDEYYEDFVNFVASNRKLEFAAAEKSAQGRVWLGSDAIKEKLTDHRGGYWEALQEAAALAGHPLDEMQTYILGRRGSLFDPLGGSAFLKQEDSLLNEMIPAGIVRQLHWASVFEQQPYLYLSPISLLEE